VGGHLGPLLPPTSNLQPPTSNLTSSMRTLALSLALGSATLVLPIVLRAQAAPGASARPAPCSRPEHRQFDFWVGQWDVTTPNGRKAGTNRITPIDGGCALREEWTGASGSSGTSLNIFDAATGRWHQTWVGNDGLLLQLDGGMKDGSMELTGATPGASGARTLHRIRWTPLSGEPARVRQLWESSTDGGRTWSVAFDGTYTRKG
jgi:hypothetical protein